MVENTSKCREPKGVLQQDMHSLWESIHGLRQTEQQVLLSCVFGTAPHEKSGGCHMTQDRKTELMKYKAVVAVLRRWLSEGHITIRDYAKLEENLAVKYRVSLCSIWRELP